MAARAKRKIPVKKLLRRYWLLICIPLVVFGLPAAYLFGLDLAWPSPNRTPEVLVESFIKKADKNRRRTGQSYDLFPIIFSEPLAFSAEIRLKFVLQSCGYNHTSDPYVNYFARIHSSNLTIVKQTVDHDWAKIEAKDPLVEESFIYSLSQKGKKWRLDSIIRLISSPNTPVIPEKTYNRWLTETQPANEFTYDPKSIVNNPISSNTEIIQTGELSLPSGLIGIHTISAMLISDRPPTTTISVLKPRITPGNYSFKKLQSNNLSIIEISINRTKTATKFSVPDRVKNEISINFLGYQFVDSLFDCQALEAVSNRDFEYQNKRIFISSRPEDSKTHQLKLNSKSDHADFLSFSSNAYYFEECYWGISDDDELVSVIFVSKSQ